MGEKLNKVAAVLKVHPRTVLRAITGDVNAYWAEGHNPDVDLEEVCIAFDMDTKVLRRCLRNSDTLLTPQEAASKILKIPLRTFRHRKYPKAGSRGQIFVRYSQHEILNYHLKYHTAD